MFMKIKSIAFLRAPGTLRSTRDAFIRFAETEIENE